MRHELTERVGALEHERSQFSAAAVDIERENVLLKAELKKLGGTPPEGGKKHA
jgi:hypothetical protein